MKHMFLSLLLAPVVACGGSAEPSPPASRAEPASGAEAPLRADAEADGAEAAIEAALAGPHRSEENRARDRYRNPKETLLFFGLEPHMTVVELSPSAGWYTEILAPVLRDGGKLVGAIPDLQGPAAKYGQRFVDRMERDPEVFDRVETVTLDPPDRVTLGPDGSADLVVTFRSTHGWINRGQVDSVFAGVYRVLAPGGIFGVVQHRAAEGADVSDTSEDGYVPEAHVIALAEKAGFELVDRSDINANPEDTRDHPNGVWSLPPNLRVDDDQKDRYREIGESDRMTLKFRKPGS
jgi:predicted methyltransferase